ncbi:hypothetical protein FHS27_003307 [Rhodopirellula rubra]|uniref:Uncharacterized protein n=1 Tax=Aporhodopirellula rubra TaxID=980271 RepID=A0A7W5E1B7_9BACT|nr:hypothetical protein [Aporhodopirellula rubra]
MDVIDPAAGELAGRDRAARCGAMQSVEAEFYEFLRASIGSRLRASESERASSVAEVRTSGLGAALSRKVDQKVQESRSRFVVSKSA